MKEVSAFAPGKERVINTQLQRVITDKINIRKGRDPEADLQSWLNWKRRPLYTAKGQ